MVESVGNVKAGKRLWRVAAEPRLDVGLASRLPACERTALPAPEAWDPDGAASLPWVEREVLPHHGATAPIERSWVGMARRRRPWLAAEPPSSPGTALAAPETWALTEQRPPVVWRVDLSTCFIRCKNLKCIFPASPYSRIRPPNSSGECAREETRCRYR